jgi:nitrogenase-stabilizing/protective protein
MAGIIDRLQELSAAEDFFKALDLPFEQRALDVNRLHILKRFQEYMRRDDVSALDESRQHSACRACLAQAYTDFLASNAVTEKVFKVFKDQQPAAPSFVALDSIKPKPR